MATNFVNDTRNQHFLPQVEQRLNTSTPEAAIKNQRIYEFDILGRFDKVELSTPKNPRIRTNLALEDVFSFDVVPNSALRQNFEALFQQYETDLVRYTEAVLAKASAKVRAEDIKADLMGLFAAKFLNFVRNPYSVPKVLNMFEGLTALRPTDREKDGQLDLVLTGSKPHQAAICKRLDLTEVQYQHWLGVLFMMLTAFENPDGQESFFDGTVRTLFNKKTTAVLVTISRYTQDKCLLSDRSVSSSIAKAGVDCLEFNLRHDAFIRFAFTNRAALIRPENAARYAELIEQMEPTLVMDYRLDDREHLAMFNLNVINQSHGHVYCATDQGILVAGVPAG